MPRTLDTLTELGAQGTMAEQAHLSDHGKLDQRYPDSQVGPKGGQVLDRHSVEEVQQTLDLEVSAARLRSSGADANQNMAYREIYTHSKLMVIDDVFITVGSANLSQRSMSFDSESISPRPGNSTPPIFVSGSSICIRVAKLKVVVIPRKYLTRTNCETNG